MAKDKERSINPAAAQRKAEKQKALKKGKAALTAQRTTRFASRNPHRLESQISDLQSLKESQGGKLSARDQKQLEEAEKDVSRIRKARETLGDKAPTFSGSNGRGGGDPRGRGRGGYQGLGKPERGGEDGSSESSETDEDVRRIPWPRDTPPPMPRQQHYDKPPQQSASTNANSEPLGAERRIPERSDITETAEQDHPSGMVIPAKPAVKTTYESAPQVRDLKKEATDRFVPTAVRKKIDASKGKGGTLLEEEEVERLEREGYGVGVGGDGKVGVDGSGSGGREGMVVEAAPVVGRGDDVAQRLREEEERFAREMEVEMGEEVQAPKRVGLEEVSDEDL